MTAAIDQSAATAELLAPVTAALRGMFGTSTSLPSLAPDLLVTGQSEADRSGWLPVSTLISGERLPELLDAAKHRWRATPHAAAALAWKAYSYWLALPVVLGWASARRVPLVHPDDVLVHLEARRPLLALGLRPSITVAVLPTDPVALTMPVPSTRGPRVRVVADETDLLSALRASLLDAHLNPLIEAIRQEVRIGGRTLLGSVASGVAYGLVRASDVLPGSIEDNTGTVLSALGLDDLVDLVRGPDNEVTVQRKTCCLAFTLPEPKICAGCCIRT